MGGHRFVKFQVWSRSFNVGWGLIWLLLSLFKFSFLQSFFEQCPVLRCIYALYTLHLLTFSEPPSHAPLYTAALGATNRSFINSYWEQLRDTLGCLSLAWGRCFHSWGLESSHNPDNGWSEEILVVTVALLSKGNGPGWKPLLQLDVPVNVTHARKEVRWQFVGCSLCHFASWQPAEVWKQSNNFQQVFKAGPTWGYFSHLWS